MKNKAQIGRFHVAQAGSYVDEAYLRFDFNHFEAMSFAQIKQVEDSLDRKSVV